MPTENPDTLVAHIVWNEGVAGAKEKYLSEGFRDYITKPFTKDQIKEKMDVIFSNDNK